MRDIRPQYSEEKNAPLAFFFLALYTVASLVRPHEFSLETAELQIIRIFAILALVFMLFTLRPLRFPVQFQLLAMMVPVVILSGILNGWAGGGFIEAERLLISSIIPFFLISNLVTSPRRQSLLMLICLVAALFMVANGHIQQSTFDGVRGWGLGGSVTVGGDEKRIAYLGFFADPNDVGMFLAMCLPICVYFVKTGNFLVRIAMLCIVAALLYGAYMTGSRGTILSFLGIIGIYFLIGRATTKLILVLAVAAPFVATLLSSFGGLQAGDGSVDGRLDAWYEGTQMLLFNPIFGVGMGNFQDLHGLVAHNSYIHVAAELGILGYSLWGGVLVLNMIASYDLILNRTTLVEGASDSSRARLEKELLLNATLFFSMIGYMVAAFFLSRNYTLTMFIFVGLHTASLLRLRRLVPDAVEPFLTREALIRAVGLAWLIILAVYIALKVAL